MQEQENENISPYEKKAFRFYLDTFKIFMHLDDQQKAQLITMIANYQLRGEEPEGTEDQYINFLHFKAQFDRDDKKARSDYYARANKKKGGAPAGNTNASKVPAGIEYGINAELDNWIEEAKKDLVWMKYCKVDDKGLAFIKTEIIAMRKSLTGIEDFKSFYYNYKNKHPDRMPRTISYP